MVVSQVRYPGGRSIEAGLRPQRRFSLPLNAYGKFLKGKNPINSGGGDIKLADIQAVLNYIVRALTVFGLIEKEVHQDEMHGYQVDSHSPRSL